MLGKIAQQPTFSRV